MRDFWMLQFFANVRLSESQSDLVNYMRIDIEMFEELFSLVETQILKKSLPYTTSYIIIYYFWSQIKFHSTQKIIYNSDGY